METVNYECLEDRVLIRPEKEKELQKTSGGIIDPGTGKKNTKRGIVVAVGDGWYARETGVLIKTVLRPGDLVLYGAAQGMPVEIESENGREEMVIMREGDVLMLISKKEAT